MLFSSCSAQFLASPVDLIRTKQTANKTLSCSANKTATRPNIFTVAKDVIKVDGILGLFSGSTALLFRAASFNVGQLLTYDKCKTEKRNCTNQNKKLSMSIWNKKNSFSPKSKYK